jgi:hypothetical protein
MGKRAFAQEMKMNVDVMIGAAAAYARIFEKGCNMDVRLNPGRSAANSLRESAKELREQVDGQLRRAERMEAAANVLARVTNTAVAGTATDDEDELEKAKALGFDSVLEMQEHQVWLDTHKTPEYMAWLQVLKFTQSMPLYVVYSMEDGVDDATVQYATIVKGAATAYASRLIARLHKEYQTEHGHDSDVTIDACEEDGSFTLSNDSGLIAFVRIAAVKLI